MATTDRVIYLLERIRASQAGVEDYEELIGLIDADDSGDIVLRMNAFHEADAIAPIPYDITYWRSVLQEVLAAGKSLDGDLDEDGETEAAAPRLPFLKHYRRWTAVAASIIILFGTGAYFFFGNRQPTPRATVSNSATKHDVPPGTNKATLTLANGSTIVLDSAANGKLAQQGSTTVLKTNNGQLAYNTTREKPTEVLYNTLVTPRGGQYQLVLPDGSKVWLNAASAIHYPTAFHGAERRVDITGEAYFEIAKDVQRPFIVMIGSPAGEKGEVKVLGTAFNINAYEDEPQTRTTLVAGSVQVKKDAASSILKPGEQAQQTSSGQINVISNADMEETLAWKNGKLSFKHAGIESIMRQAARWYDVDIVIKDKIEDTYTLSAPRNVPLSKLLAVLELNGGVHFTVEGKKITVTK